jgi:MFS family permease
MESKDYGNENKSLRELLASDNMHIKNEKKNNLSITKDSFLSEIKLRRYDNSDSLNHELTVGIRRGFGKFMRKMIFILIVIIDILLNVDHGAIPAATTILMNELKLDSFSLGVIGSILFFGLTCGAIAAGPLFNNYAPKWIISISIIGCSFCLYSFTESNTMAMLSFWRFACGFCQIFALIYFPVWVDKFGINENRIIWISYLQLAGPLGTMFGYLLEAFSIRMFDNWKVAFYIQILLLISAGIVLIFTPDKFFSKNYRRTDLTRSLKKSLEESGEENFDFDFWKKNLVINGPKYTRLSDFSIFSLQDEEENAQKNNLMGIVNSLLSNRTYAFVMLSICCLLFIVTAIQFWITDYMIKVIKLDTNKANILFIIVCITAPTFGVISGGYLIEKLGGSNDKRSLEACYKVSIMAAVCGLPLPFINNYIIFVFLMWMLLFLGGSIMPGMTGIMLNSAPIAHKEVANSLTYFCYNVIGYLPAPVIYGLIRTYTGGDESIWGLAFVMSVSVFGVLFLRYARKSRNNDEKEIENQKQSIFRNYLDHKRYETINSPESLKKTEAITALYGRVSL